MHVYTMKLEGGSDHRRPGELCDSLRNSVVSGAWCETGDLVSPPICDFQMRWENEVVLVSVR